MQLHIDKDTAYLFLLKPCSVIAGFYHLTNTPHTSDIFLRNGVILIEWKTLRHVVESAAESEVGGFFHNAQMEIPIKNKSEALGNPQKLTPTRTDNSTETGFVYDSIHMKRSKSWDMRYYWLRDRITKEQFKIYWQIVVDNESHNFTKHHTTVYYKNTRSRYISIVPSA